MLRPTLVSVAHISEVVDGDLLRIRGPRSKRRVKALAIETGNSQEEDYLWSIEHTGPRPNSPRNGH